MFVHRGWGNIFFQEDPTEEYFYLTSTGVGDVATPGRPRTAVFDPDTRHSGEFVRSEFIRGEPGDITAPFTRPLDTVNNYLQELQCAVNARINHACRGDRTIPFNYEIAQILLDGEFETSATGQPVVAQPGEDDRVMTNGDLKALAWTYLYLLFGVAQDVTGTTPIYDIAFVPPECGDRCGPRINLGCLGYASCGTLGYLLGNNMFFTDDCGANWANTAADPFLGSKAAGALLIAETSTGHRIIVCGGTEAGVPAEISYSDDGGVTWNDVIVGAVNGQALNAICRDMLGRIWVAGTGGQVYMSTNLGVTWTLMVTTDTAEDLNGIVAVGSNLIFAVGDANDFNYTPDGGTTWDVMVGPAAGQSLMSIDANRYNYLFVSTDDGELWRTINYGEDWVQILDMGGGEIPRVRFEDNMKYFGGLVYNTAAGVGTMYRSEDGGVTWYAWDTPVNTGLESLFLCDPNMIYICGDDAGADGYIAKFVRAET